MKSHRQTEPRFNNYDCSIRANDFIKMLRNGNTLFNGYHSDRLLEILEDNYGIYNVRAPGHFRCRDFDSLLIQEIDKKYGSSFLDSIIHVADSLDELLPDGYTRDSIPLSYSINPSYVGGKDELRNFLNLNLVECPANYHNDTFILCYKLWLGIDGKVIKSKKLLSYNSYWDSLVNNRMNFIGNFTPAYIAVLGKKGEYYITPSIIHINFTRRFNSDVDNGWY